MLGAVLLVVPVALWALQSSPQPATEATEAPEAPELTEAPAPGLQLLAHRGLHQTFSRDGLTDETCTAERIDEPVHSYLENTVTSMEAAFDAGAAIVEIDIAPTSDDVLVVFHDWTVDCRTEASGAIRDISWAEASALDIGYGYTSDGTTYPFRGQGIGLMPKLEEVFLAFPDGQFLINFKSNDIAEAQLLFELVEQVDAHDQVWAVYGGEDNVAEYRSLANARGFSEPTVTACLVEYASLGFPEDLPPECHDTILLVPVDLGQALPGWPNAFAQKLAEQGTDLIVRGPDGSGIDTVPEFEALPDGLDIYVWTNRIDLLGTNN